VWVFTRSGSTWTQQGEKLTGSGEVGKGEFGDNVALSSNGNTAIIGGAIDNATVGAVWMFTRSEGKWTQQGEKLTGGEEVGAGAFGGSVALSSDGNTALIGGLKDDKNLQEPHGAAWVFTRSEGKWTQQGPKLTGGGESGETLFGSSVALSSDGNTALIGGKWDGVPFTKKSGAAWVFTRSGGNWTQQGAKLAVAEPREVGYEFGNSVALSSNGNTALIGAYRYGATSGSERGAAWVFTRSESKWSEEAKLTPKSAIPKAEMGWGVALSADGNTALAGSKFQNESGGAVWVFVKSGGSWFQEGKEFTGTDDEKAQAGTSVALSSGATTALVGGPADTDLVGAAWAYSYLFSPEELYGIENEAEPNQHRPCAGDPVNCATGNQVEVQTDLSVGGRGPGLNLTRTYNSQLAASQSAPGPFGYGWTGPCSAHLVTNEEEETAVVHQNNGSTVLFNLTASKTYVAAGFVQATLVKEGSTYIYTLPDQSKLDFNTAGQLTSETDRDGNAITPSYNSEGELEAVTDGAGRKLTFAYNSEGFVESVKDPMGHTVKYTYESGNLASVTQPGEVSLRWQFKYNSEHEMTSETDGREHAVTTEYDSSHRAIAQTDAMERKRKWEYSSTEEGEPVTIITEPNGAVTVETFNNALLPISITHAYGESIAATTTYEYDSNFNLIAVTDPNKHATKYGYDTARESY
jgi:YD repeat-containing protein